jgi:nitrite reductase/ring-hydroxylating ferredoxin subunit
LPFNGALVNATMHNWLKVAELADLTPGQGMGLDIGGKLVGIFLIAGRVYALSDVCTHAFALLSSGFVEGNEIECPLHFARFDIATGRCTSGPAETDVPSISVKIHEGGIYLDPEELTALTIPD